MKHLHLYEELKQLKIKTKSKRFIKELDFQEKKRKIRTDNYQKIVVNLKERIKGNIISIEYLLQPDEEVLFVVNMNMQYEDVLNVLENNIKIAKDLLSIFDTQIKYWKNPFALYTKVTDKWIDENMDLFDLGLL